MAETDEDRSMAETDEGRQLCHCCRTWVRRLHLMLYTDEMLCDSCAEEYAEDE
jgi:hypothetical protein